LRAIRRWLRIAFSQAPDARWDRAVLLTPIVRRLSALLRGLTIGAPIFATRIHGRGSILYLQGAGANAVPFSNAANFDLSISFSTADVSGLGDDWQTFVRGMLGFTGSIDGPVDTANTNPWDAAVSTSVSKFYLYPDKTAMTQYYYGTAWIDVDVKGGTGAPVTFTSKLTGSGQLAKNP
jgi:hypothetical protein